MPYVGIGLALGKGFFLSGGINPDVQAFIDATGITNETTIIALNNYVNSLQDDGIWDKQQAIYPFVGGTASTCSYNLKNPTQFQITWNGSPSFSDNGVRFLGAQWGDTGFNPFGNSTLNDFSYSLYCNVTAQESSVDIGCRDGGDRCEVYLSFPNDNLIVDINNGVDNSGRIFVSYSGGLGFITVSRNMINNMIAYKNATSLLSTSGANSGNYPNYNIFIGATNNAGTASLFSNKRFALAAIGQKLNGTEVSNYNIATQAFQTALGRA